MNVDQNTYSTRIHDEGCVLSSQMTSEKGLELDYSENVFFEVVHIHGVSA